jgi:hypothetical protein
MCCRGKIERPLTLASQGASIFLLAAMLRARREGRKTAWQQQNLSFRLQPSDQAEALLIMQDRCDAFMRAVSGHQGGFDSDADRFRSVVRAHLGQHIGTMDFHRARTDRQLLANHAVG